MRLEIEHAKKHDKNIIPIMLNGFEFPEELPGSIDFIRFQNSLSSTIQYYDEFIRKLEKQYLLTKPSGTKENLQQVQ